MDQYNRPTECKIGPHVYRILYSKESWKKYAAASERDNYGMTIAEQCVILINPARLNSSQMRDTILHEILHALFALYGFANLPVDLPTEKHDSEEVIVLLLSTVLLQAMQDNKELFEWLANE